MDQLREALLLAPDLDGDLRKVIEHVCQWKWKMSAAGFFTVDRSVLAGVSFLFSNSNFQLGNGEIGTNYFSFPDHFHGADLHHYHNSASRQEDVV